MSTIIIQQDTREQLGKKNHILDYFNSVGVKVVRSKLFVGDYTLLNKQDVCVDVKQNCLELFSCLTKEHERFKRELVRAQENEIKLIILTEEQLAGWVSPVWNSNTKSHKAGEPMSKTNPHTIKKIISTMENKYGVEFMFCNKSETGKRILEVLCG